MSTSRSIQVSVTHTVLGIVIGAAIEALLPKFNEGASLSNQAFETLVQVGLNGAALATVSGFLRDDDPTFGMPFSMALFQSQPELALRIGSLSAVAKDQLSQAAQRTTPRAVAV
jgi:hypothetical protein